MLYPVMTICIVELDCGKEVHWIVYEFNGIKACDSLRETRERCRGQARRPEKWDYG